MNRRRFGVALTLLGACGALAGCEWLHHQVRPKDDDPEVERTSGPAEPVEGEKDEPETKKILDVQSQPGKARPFFRSSRLPGSMSDEGREIERDLGIQ